MNILIITQYFPPDVTAAAYRMGDTVRLLRAWGHEVRVITATPHKGGMDHAHGEGLNDAGVIRVPVQPLAGRGVRDYLEQYLGFALRALWQALRLRRSFSYDVVWASSPPLFIALCLLPLRWLAWRPTVLDVRDLWPESAVGIGKVRRGSMMEKIGKALEWAAYRFSNALTCVSQPMREYIGGRTNKPVTVVYNGIPEAQVSSDGGQTGNPDVFCYAGNLGFAQGLEGVLQAFALAKSRDGMAAVELHLVGTGAVEGELRALAEQLGIAGSVCFYGVKPKAEALALMASAGTLLVPLLDSPAFAITVPSKVFDCMGLGRPVIACIRGEGADILSGAEGGNLVVAPGDVPALAEAFFVMRRDWHTHADRAGANRGLVVARFTRESAVRELERTLQSVMRKV